MTPSSEATSAEFLFDDAADLSLLDGATVAVIGYGNQGRSQALNLRDEGIDVLVGAPRDSTAAEAEKDGLRVGGIAEVVAKAKVVMLLVPDEVQAAIFDDQIRPSLQSDAILCFAHGFNVHYGVIVPPPDVDVVLVAPRMIGKGVRDTFVDGEGFPSLVAVAQDHSGKALDHALAIAKGIGSTKAGVIVSTFKEETELDLYMEQIGNIYAIRANFEVLTEAGYAPEAILLELFASGETAEIFKAAHDIGLFHQLRLHSRTSQYGQQVTAERFQDPEARKSQLRKVIGHIQSGEFAKEWEAEREAGLVNLKAKTDENLRHPMQVAENRLYRILNRRDQDITEATWLD
ncbi:MAG: ketol-acid reductoisomerase [Solirubrobacterales bacterium]